MTDSKIFLALDGMDMSTVHTFAREMRPYVAGGKVNDLIDEYGAACLDRTGFRMRFMDPKIKDIKNTVRNRIMRYKAHANFVTVHASMGPDALREAAITANEIGIKVIAVTVLTDISSRQCTKIYGKPAREAVKDLAMKARRAGLHGIVCSPSEVSIVRSMWSTGIIIVPGIRLADSESHDQKRVGTPYQAIINGADYLVCGRPITKQPSIDASIAVLEQMNEEVMRASAYLSP